MSIINNLAVQHTVNSTDYNVSLAADALIRMGFFRGLCPIIKWGLQVSIGTGLTVNVTAGQAQGPWFQFPQLQNTPVLPLDVDTPDSVVPVEANGVGYIVLNVNITPNPANPAEQYTVQADNNGGPPAITPVFVKVLENPNPGTSYPYAQITLAKVTVGASGVTAIDTIYNPNFQLSNRSYDISQFMASLPLLGTLAYQNVNNVTVPVTFNAGAYIELNPADTTGTRVASQDYANGQVITNSNGTCWILPGGLKIQIMNVNVPPQNVDRVEFLVTFPAPFTNLSYFICPISRVGVDQSRGMQGIPGIDTKNGPQTLTTSLLTLDSNEQTDVPIWFDIPQNVVILAMGI